MSPVLGVPALPPLDDQLLVDHAAAHAELHRAFGDADPTIDALFRFVQFRIVEEALAGISVPSVELCFGRRRCLSSRDEARLRGARRSLSHVDARLEMWRNGHVDELVGIDTPEVLNVLAESENPDDRETDPGLVRGTASTFTGDVTDFVPPDQSACAELLRQAIDVVNRAPAPAIARAGWFTVAMLSIHPFVDGNGRTARAAFQLIASSELDAGFDWGTVEAWTIERSRYIDALMQAQARARPDYRGDLIDPAPFMEFACTTSTRGARHALDRLRSIDETWRGDWDSSSAEARLVELAVWMQGTASLDELAMLIADPVMTITVNDLVAASRLVWSTFGVLVLAPNHPLRAMP